MANLESVIPDELRRKEQRPTELLELLIKKYEEFEIKRALAKLLDVTGILATDGPKVELTSKRILRVLH